jgi:hypothetical protein
VSQPSNEESDTYRRPIPGHTVCLIAMCAIGSAALALLLVDVPRGVYAVLASAIAVAGVGWFVGGAEDRVNRRIDALATDDDEVRRQGYASGYVDGAARHTPDGQLAQLHSFNGRASS